MKKGTELDYNLFIDKYDLQSWARLNQELTKIKNIPGVEVQAYLGCHQALKEISIGLSQLFMHKMSVAVVQGTSFFVDQNSKDFSRLGYKVQSTTWEKADKNWVESLAKDTLLVLYSADHPITGELYPYENIQALFHQKKIFTVMLSHAQHFYRPKPTSFDPYEVRVEYMGPGRAIALLGERSKVVPATTQFVDFSEFDKLSFMPAQSELSENRKLVEDFEAALVAGAKPYFSMSQSRLYDRAVINFADVDGAAITELLIRENPSYQGKVETTSLCAWPAPQQIDWMAGGSIKVSDLRSLVVVSAELLNDKSFVSKLTKAHQEIKKLQG